MIVCMPHCGAKPNSTSGGEVVERELLTRLPGVEIEPHVYAPTLPGLRWWNSPLWFEVPLRHCLTHHAPALIRAHSLRYTGLAALAARWVTDLPLTVHYHHLEADHLSWLDRVVLRHADQVTTDSEFSRLQAPPGVKAHVVRLGVDHRRFLRSPLPAGHVVLLAGGTKIRKNTAFVRRLWPEVVRQVPDAALLEVGQGSRVDDRFMPSYYRVARVVAFPSLLEGFGLPALEAMACGRPVVMSREGALPEFGIETTRLVPDLWVQRLVMLLTDREAWNAEAEHNYLVSLQYSWEQTAMACAALWRMLA